MLFCTVCESNFVASIIFPFWRYGSFVFFDIVTALRIWC